jgi:hypothetical protein
LTASIIARTRRIRSNDAWDEGLPAEAGVDRHHQHLADDRQALLQHDERRRRVEGDAGRRAGLLDRPKRAVQMGVDLERGR